MPFKSANKNGRSAVENPTDVRRMRFSKVRKGGLELKNGAVAQLVEQRTENPCVGGSIPPHTTHKQRLRREIFRSLFVLLQLYYNKIVKFRL